MKNMFFFLVLAIGACTNKQNKMLAHDINLYKETPAWDLARLVQKEDVESIVEICKKEPELLKFQESRFGQSLLEWSVYTNRYNSAKVLAECGADPNLQSFDGTSAFLLAADKQETSDYLRLLLKYGGNVNAIAKPRDTSEVQPLGTSLIAACRYNLENVKLLVESGADVNSCYRTICPLYEACLHSNIEIVKFLIEKGADYKAPLLTTLDSKPRYIHELMRSMCFKLDSDSYKTKMEVAEFLKKNGMDYWKTEIPPHLYNIYPKEYLEKY